MIVRDTRGGDQKYHMHCDIYVYPYHCNLKYDIPQLICDYYHKNKLILLPTFIWLYIMLCTYFYYNNLLVLFLYLHVGLF